MTEVVRHPDQADSSVPSRLQWERYAVRRGDRWRDIWIGRLIKTIAVSTIAAIVLIFLFIGREAAPVLTSAEVHQEVTVAKMVVPLASRPGQPNAFIWQPVSDTPKYSLLPLLLGTLKATLIAILFAAPFAVGAAIYSSEFAPPRIREVIKPVIEMLAGIPSVVMGFFALMVLASVLKDSFGWKFRLNATNAGIALGVAIIPVIYTVAEGALRAVPRHLREAAQALGATPWETARRVILPAAAPGIFAGVALGLGRAVGETMIVLLASGNAAIWSADLTDSIRTMSATIAAELAEVVNGSAHYHVLFFIGALLFLITFLVNSLGELYIGRLRRRLTGVAG